MPIVLTTGRRGETKRSHVERHARGKQVVPVSNVACAIVNKKLSCSTTPNQCSASGSTVTCNVGTLAPLAISDLNGGAMTIKVQVTAEPTTMCGTKPCTINTATVGAINTDTNSNPHQP
jgi:hypothetical protein